MGPKRKSDKRTESASEDVPVPDGLNDKLLKALECPVCLHLMVPPIELCMNGHSICSKCRSSVKICPACRGPFMGVRNFLAEQMAEELCYPCVNVEEGCSLKLLLKEKEIHETKCPLRVYNCILKECIETWRGRRSEMLIHFRKTHFSKLYLTDKSIISIKPFNFEKTSYEKRMIAFRDKIFLFVIKLDSITRNMLMCCQYIGKIEDACQSCYQIIFDSNTTSENMRFTLETRNELEDIENIFAARKCVILSSEMVIHFTNEDHALEFKLNFVTNIIK